MTTLNTSLHRTRYHDSISLEELSARPNPALVRTLIDSRLMRNAFNEPLDVDFSDTSAVDALDKTKFAFDRAIDGVRYWDGVVWAEAEFSKIFAGHIAVQNLSELRALSGLKDGQLVCLLGRVNVLDGGEGLFVWNGVNLVNRTTLDEVTAGQGDGGVYVAPASDTTGASGAFAREFTGKHSAGWYGANPSAPSAQIVTGLTAAARRPGGFRLPAGTYNIDTSLSIFADVEFDDGAGFALTAGNFVFIDGYVEAGPRQRLLSSGALAISSRTEETHPAWWGADTTGSATADSAPAIQACINNSSFQSNIAVITDDARLGSRIGYPNTARSKVNGIPIWRPLGGNPNAVVFFPGNALGTVELPRLYEFTGRAIEIQSNLSRIFCPEFNSCGTCVTFLSGPGGVRSSVLDSVVTTEAMSNCDTAMNVEMGTPTDIIQGCGIVGSNFMTNTTNGVVYTGAPGFCDGLLFEWLAIDFTPARSGGALMENQIAGFDVPRLNIKVSSWFGGDGFEGATPTQLVRGSFFQCNFEYVAVRDFDQRHMTNANYFGGRIHAVDQRAVAAAPSLSGVGAGLGAFTGGTATGRMTGRVTDIVEMTLPALNSGQAVAFEYFNIWADDRHLPWLAQIMGQAAGLSVSVNDQSGATDGLLLIEVRNESASAIAAGRNLRVRLNRI